MFYRRITKNIFQVSTVVAAHILRVADLEDFNCDVTQCYGSAFGVIFFDCLP
jgi:hypothetical protein